jgi:hypothetical protein
METLKYGFSRGIQYHFIGLGVVFLLAAGLNLVSCLSPGSLPQWLEVEDVPVPLWSAVALVVVALASAVVFAIVSRCPVLTLSDAGLGTGPGTVPIPWEEIEAASAVPSFMGRVLTLKLVHPRRLLAQRQFRLLFYLARFSKHDIVLTTGFSGIAPDGVASAIMARLPQKQER